MDYPTYLPGLESFKFNVLIVVVSFLYCRCYSYRRHFIFCTFPRFFYLLLMISIVF